MAAARMHDDEVDVDEPLVRQLVASQFPQWTGLPVRRVLPAGTDNAIFRLGEDVAARLPRRHGTVEPLEKELRWLPRLAPHLPVAVPVPLARGVPGEGYPFPWAVCRWVRGDNATPDRIDDQLQAARELAEFVRALQRIDASDGPRPGRHNFNRGEPLARRDESTRKAIAALAGELDAETLTAAWDAALRTPAWDGPTVWIHGDLDSRNLLVEGGRLSGVIDFGCLGVGDPACEVMVAWKLLSPDARELFRSVLAVDDATWARSRGWALSQAVGALSYYTEETNAVLVREARRWLAEVLGDIAQTGA
jgi:aminoglycoside phosphotransferase (APT) family kinase protein